MNGHVSVLRAWCAWLTKRHYLEVNPAKRIKLVGRQEASSREGLSDNKVNAALRVLVIKAIRAQAVKETPSRTDVAAKKGQLIRPKWFQVLRNQLEQTAVADQASYPVNTFDARISRDL